MCSCCYCWAELSGGFGPGQRAFAALSSLAHLVLQSLFGMTRWNRTLGLTLGVFSFGVGAPEAQAAQSDAASSAGDGYLWREQEKPAPPPRPSPLQAGWQVSAFTGYGHNTLDGVVNEYTGELDEWPNPLGFGVGLRGRYQFSFGLALGLRASHHLGAPGDDVQVTLGHLEAGWALPLGPLRGELFAGAGVARMWSGSEIGEICMADGSLCAPAETGSPFSATLELGLTLAYPFAERYFLAATGEGLALENVLGISGYLGVGATF